MMTIPALWSFAKDWYGNYLQVPGANDPVRLRAPGSSATD